MQFIDSVQFNSVAQSYPILCDPMNCSMPGLAVHHQLSEFIQTHVHWIGDAIGSSYPPAFNLSQHQGLFQWVSSSHQVAKASVLPMNIQDWFPLGWTGFISLQSKGLQHHNSKVGINSSAFSFLYGQRSIVHLKDYVSFLQLLWSGDLILSNKI